MTTRPDASLPFACACAALGAVASLSSCQTYEARPLVPEDVLAALRSTTLDGLAIEHARPGEAEAAPRPRFDPSDGLDEGELIAIALTLNPALRSKRLQIGESQSLLIAAGMWPNPDLGAFLRGGIDGGAASSYGLDLLFGLPRPDERPARRAVAETRILVTRAEIAADELVLASEVKRARLAVLAAESVARRLEQESAIRAEAARVVRRQRELGEATEINVAFSDLDQATFVHQVQAARSETASARRTVNALLGLPPSFALDLSGLGKPLAFVVYDDLEDAEIERRVLAGRFDVRAKAAGYEQSEAELRLAIAKQFPRLGIGPSFERDSDKSSSLGIGISLELPLFDRNQAEIAEKSVARERARAEYGAALHRALAQAFEARARLRAARAEVERQRRDVVPLVERADRLCEQSFAARELSVLEWLTARGRSLAAHKDLLEALVRHGNAVAELEAATGTSLSAPTRQQPAPGESK